MAVHFPPISRDLSSSKTSAKLQPLIQRASGVLSLRFKAVLA
jgi:hypothetical protein